MLVEMGGAVTTSVMRSLENAEKDAEEDNELMRNKN